MLDEFGSELENTDSRLDTTMKKVAKVLHMSNGTLEHLFRLFVIINSIICFRSSPVDCYNSFIRYPCDCDTFIYTSLIILSLAFWFL